jgi:hypothetical protein
MIAAVHDRGALVAIQRIFLEPDGRGLAGDIIKPKRLLGRPLTGAVMLQPVADCLGLAEGVETAMSASLLLRIPVWAALGGERFGRVLIPPAVKRLILLPDDDVPGQLAASRARQAYASDKLVVETIWPWSALNDWNDVLLEEGEGAGAGRG